MKVLCVIDSLGSGGAQRQMLNLALGLKEKGHHVELLVYHPSLRFFRPEIDAAGIVVHEVTKGRGFSLRVIKKLVKLYREEKYDGTISFLDTPNLYCCIAKYVSQTTGVLVVSERSSVLGERNNLYNRTKRYPYVVATYVVSNSHTQTRWLENNSRHAGKAITIYNGYKVTRSGEVEQPPVGRSSDTMMVIGRISPEKNGVALVKALVLYYMKHGNCPSILWAGRQEFDKESLQTRREMEELLSQHPMVGAKWQFLGERSDIPALLLGVDALIHVSQYEGLPNAVCEAFISARPVIASNVCDHPLLIDEGTRGFLCDPHSSWSICSALERFTSLTREERSQMGLNARLFAEKYLTVERMVSHYEALLR